MRMSTQAADAYKVDHGALNDGGRFCCAERDLCRSQPDNMSLSVKIERLCLLLPSFGWPWPRILTVTDTPCQGRQSNSIGKVILYGTVQLLNCTNLLAG